MRKLCETHPHLKEEWDYSKNVVNFELIATHSHKKCWWICEKGHSFDTRVDSRTYQNRGCPYCNRNKKQVSLAISNPDVLNLWDYKKNEIDPSKITSGSHQCVWWRCNKGHSWQASIVNRSKSKNKCPFCLNKWVCKENDLNNYPALVKELHPIKNGSLKASEIICCSYGKVWWLGNCGHEWNTSPRTRTRKIRPTGCPFCNISKGEARIRAFLTSINIVYEEQKRFMTCKDCKSLPFDFYVTDKNLLIEFHGIQHYEPTDFGMGQEKVNLFFQGIQKRDQIKVDWAKANGYKLVVVSYKDLYQIESLLTPFF